MSLLLFNTSVMYSMADWVGALWDTERPSDLLSVSVESAFFCFRGSPVTAAPVDRQVDSMAAGATEPVSQGAGTWKVASQSVRGSVYQTGGGASEGTAVTQVGTMGAVDSAEAVGWRGGRGSGCGRW